MSNLTDHLDGVGRPVAYFPKIARALGGVKQGLLVCQLYYLDGKQRDDDGWIYKTAIEITEETGLSYEEQTTARRELKKKKILEERHDRLDHKMYYRINKEALNAVWQAWVEKEVAPIPEQGKTQFGDEAKPNSGMRQNPIRSIEHRLQTETTTETTLSKSHSPKKSLKNPPPTEVQLVREITLRYPPKDLWAAITRKVEGKTKEQIGACYEAWRLKGYSPTNYNWLDWLEHGIPQNGHQKPPKDPTVWPSPDLLIDMYNELTPDECPAVETRSPARLQKAEQALAIATDREYWVETFKQFHSALYLRGKAKGYEGIVADFDWLLAVGKDGSENFVKVHDGKYHD